MKVFESEKDKLLDHEYDGIKELDNHMPFWWLWLFWCTIAFAVVYLMYYQVLGWGPTQHEEYEQAVAAAEAKFGGSEQQSAADFTWTISEDQEDIKAGRELFMSSQQLCYTCHGNKGQGMVGPNLTDKYWMHGCTPEDIASSIINGYPDKGMLAYGSGTKISNEKVQQLVSYIASLQGTNPDGAKEPNMDRAQPCSEGPLAATE